ncbi:MAG: alpha-L-fucosidase [Akkermansiaceae bacterium]|nr:alpha-L-fucosidase [Verrucomicrobiales bacterium]
MTNLNRSFGSALMLCLLVQGFHSAAQPRTNQAATTLEEADYASRFDPGVMGPPDKAEVVAAAKKAVRKEVPPGPFKATWDSIQNNYRTPAWFEDARFGIFMHWGVYAVPAYHNEWYEKHMYRNFSRWHAEHFGSQEKFGYKDFIPMFKAEKFNPDDWAELFRRSGAKYVMPTAQHHDNYALWDSDLTHIDAMEMGPKRDLIGDLAKAVRKKGLKFGVSNHGIENFTFINPTDELRDRLQAAKADLYDPAWAAFYNVADKSDAAVQRFLTDWVNRNLELIDKYQPDMLWFDNGVNSRGLDPLKTYVAAYYYNRALEWKKEVAISTKGLAYAPSGKHMEQVGSIMDFEKVGQRSPPTIRPGPWQVDHPIGSSWGYTSNMTVSRPAALISHLVDTVSKGGNFLLNISPKADGTIPQAQQDTLLGIGQWLEKNGEGIYGTRPWKKFGEGTARFTTKGQTLYVILLRWPDKELKITSLAKSAAGQIEKVEWLGQSGAVEFSQTDNELTLRLPAAKPDDFAQVFKISGLKL